MFPALSIHLIETFRLAAHRTGIHQPLLEALYAVHQTPVLADGTTGLGLIPANQIRAEEIDAIAPQIQVAASTVQSLLQALILQGWQAADLWDAAEGRYTDVLIHRIAQGYIPSPADPAAARLELCAVADLYQAYQARIAASWQGLEAIASQAFLDAALLDFVPQLPGDYVGLAYQQHAYLEGARLWHHLGDRAAITAYLTQSWPTLSLDAALCRWVQTAIADYTGYPHQREALLRLVQLWVQLSTREQTIWALQHGKIQPDPALMDLALMTFVQHLPRQFNGSGEQRNALVEGFRAWKGLATRAETLMALGLDPALFTAETPDPAALRHATHQTDLALLEFLHHVPALYSGSPAEQTALVHMADLWFHPTTTPTHTRQQLLALLRQTETARRDSVDALPPPCPNLVAFPQEIPAHGWTPATLQLNAAIAPNSSFTWASATSGGVYWPTEPAIVERICAFAAQLQAIRDRLGRPLTILCWYTPGPHPIADLFLHSRHALGDAAIVYCDGLTGQQLYWFLAPWWSGKLAYHAAYPHLCYLDARGDRVRQIQPVSPTKH